MRSIGRVKRRRVVGFLAALQLLVAACGSPDPSGSTAPANSVIPSADGLRVTCGDVDLGTPAEVRLPDTPLDDEATAALNGAAKVLAGEELISLYTWSISVSGDSHLVLFGRAKEAEVAEAPYVDASFTNDGSGWRFSSLGQCRITVDAPGFGPARLVLNPDSEPDPADSAVDVWIQERACANGEAPTNRDVIPVVIADEQRIVITVLVEPVERDATCASNPWHPIVVTFDESLGDRQILDGNTVPPEPLDWPPSQADLNL